MEILDNEIYNSGNFIQINQSTNDVLDNQAKFLDKYNLDTDHKIPFLYWTAKLHKNPYSHRFITSGRGCTTQPLSIKVGHCLKTILTILRSNAKLHRKKPDSILASSLTIVILSFHTSNIATKPKTFIPFPPMTLRPYTQAYHMIS